MQTKLNPANFFLNAFYFFLLFLIPFVVIRLYFYFNYFFSSHDFVIQDFLKMMFWGLRFDLSVVGFLLLPIYVLYFISHIEILRRYCYLLGQIYKVSVLVGVFLVFHFNIAFLDTNVPFDVAYWMHWPDYRSIFFLDCKVCYWDYDYLSSVRPMQIVNGLMLLLILFGIFSRWAYFSDRFNIKREVLFFVALALMARGKIGKHHIRYEDSVWHSHPLINTLSNNPLWLIDKTRN